MAAKRSSAIFQEYDNIHDEGPGQKCQKQDTKISEAEENFRQLFKQVLGRKHEILNANLKGLVSWQGALLKGELTARRLQARLHDKLKDHAILDEFENSMPEFSDLILDISSAIQKVRNQLQDFEDEIPKFVVDHLSAASQVSAVIGIILQNVPSMQILGHPTDFKANINAAEKEVLDFVNKWKHLESDTDNQQA